ncbi:MAG: hypothetical protein HY905_01100 [Deltaproteobacteria bacterium]|nr:hypothetical protein [Deltaproteobacteria bacterium]
MALRACQRVLLGVVRAQPDREYPLDAAGALEAEGRAELLRLLRQHGLCGWAHRVFVDAGVALPGELTEALRAEHAQNTARSILALAAYERLSRLFSGAGIEHIPRTQLERSRQRIVGERLARLGGILRVQHSQIRLGQVAQGSGQVRASRPRRASSCSVGGRSAGGAGTPGRGTAS